MTNDKVIKISEEAHNVIKDEIRRRINQGYIKVSQKEIASDLILERSEQIKKRLNEQKNYEQLTCEYIINQIKSVESHKYDREIVRLFAKILYWDHIKLALSRGMNATEAKEHVYQHLTSKGKLDFVVKSMELYLKNEKWI